MENLEWVAKGAEDRERASKITRIVPQPLEGDNCHFQNHPAFLLRFPFSKKTNTGIVSFEEIQIRTRTNVV